MKNMKERVFHYLLKYPETRGNDNLLIARVCSDLYGTTDMNDLVEIGSNTYETIRRTRQRIQEYNPNLMPSSEISKKRHKKEEKMREEYGQL